MRRWQLLGLGLGAYFLGLLITAPAVVIDVGLQRASDGWLHLADAQGTLWSGAGRIELRDAGGHSGATQNIAWRCLPASLLRGHLACEIEQDQVGKRFTLVLSWSHIELADADLSLPAAGLGLALPKLAALGLSGDLQLHAPHLFVERGAMRGEVTLQWRNAGSALTPVSPLGDYELSIRHEGNVAHAVLRTLRGPLQLDGRGSWNSGEKPVFLATARVPAQHQSQLVPLLRLIAVKSGEDSYELRI